MRIIVIRKRYLLITIVLLISVFLARHKYNKKESEIVTFLPISNKIIGIDPGHGGVDPGAVGTSGIKEDKINLQIAKNLKRLIEQSGGIVILTRNTDDGLYSDDAKTLRQMKNEDLRKRKEIIDNSGCEIFVSIHLNSFTRSNYYGAQTFYRKGSEEGERLAYIIQDELRNILDKDNKREPQERDDVYLLNEIEIPSTLVECGFLSNKEEELLLDTPIYQEKIAWSIYIGIMNYFTEKATVTQ
ncbi:MAG: N-acetylmuramoyl-L-alanine amidase CwlD [Tissierellaceae bacterium]|nr:N-acetylmuramoyl-L-alanine amidase CwlD [Tissierellaceae bacterium]